MRGIAGLSLAALGLAPAAALAAGPTERVSVSSTGAQGFRDSYAPSLSADGRLVAFSSGAAKLVPGDYNHERDVFVRNLRTGETTLVSRAQGGGLGNGTSDFPVMSRDGRFVAFDSEASNLVPGDTNASFDVFIRDRLKGTTDRVSVGSHGAQGNGSSFEAGISDDGRYVAFTSGASNLVPGDTNDSFDVFVRDRLKGITERVSLGPKGVQANDSSLAAAISGDGHVIVFQSSATNLAPGDTQGLRNIYRRDLRTGRVERVSDGPDGAIGDSECFSPSVSRDGRYTAFSSDSSNLVPDDTNGRSDVFVHDSVTGKTERVSVGPGGRQANGFSFAFERSISAVGRYVAFQSLASNLAVGDTNDEIDVYLHDRLTGRTEFLSRGLGGHGGDRFSEDITISADGRLVAFASRATNLVPHDTNSSEDIFVTPR